MFIICSEKYDEGKRAAMRDSQRFSEYGMRVMIEGAIESLRKQHRSERRERAFILGYIREMRHRLPVASRKARGY